MIYIGMFIQAYYEKKRKSNDLEAFIQACAETKKMMSCSCLNRW